MQSIYDAPAPPLNYPYSTAPVPCRATVYFWLPGGGLWLAGRLPTMSGISDPRSCLAERT